MLGKSLISKEFETAVYAVRDKTSQTSVLDPYTDNPTKWVEKARILNGAPFSFKNREYLYQIYNEQSKETYISKGRQTELSECIANLILYLGWKHPGSTIVYCSDRDSHTSKFSNQRIKKKCITSSQVIQAELCDIRNHTATKLVMKNDSIVYFVASWSGYDQVRSIDADFVFLDEIQSQDVSEIDVVRAGVSHSPHGRIFGVGTGDDYQTSWSDLYHNGRQYEWESKSKQWVAKNPDADYASYNLPQTIVPWITPNMIEDQKKKMASPRRFITEVMGQFWKGQKRPLTMEAVKKLFRNELTITPAATLDRTRGPVIAGIDWGGGGASDTVVWIDQVVNSEIPIFETLDIIRINDTQDVQEIADRVVRILKEYEPDKGVQDAGGNSYGIQAVENNFGESITKCSFMVRPADPMLDDKLVSENLIKVDKSWICETVINGINHLPTNEQGETFANQKIPHGTDELEWIIDHLINNETKTANLHGQTRVIYDKVKGKNNDAFMALCYKTIAWRLHDQHEEIMVETVQL